MADSMFDLYRKMFVYKGHTCQVIIDNYSIPWFSGKDVATFLKYVDTNQAIRFNVEDIDKRPLGELYQFMKKIPENSQDNAIYINETGLYCLMFGSKKELAKKFKMWVLRTILPSIREFGYFQLDEKYMTQIAQLNEQLKMSRSTIRMLENNQKKQKFPDGGLVYALEPMGIIIKKKGKKLFRLGKSILMRGRWSTHNSSVPDNFKLLHHVQVDDPIAVEKCCQAALHKYIYRGDRSYYICTGKEVVRVLDGCAKMVQGGFPFECVECHQTMESLDILINHAEKEHNGNLLKNTQQIGGMDEFEEEYDPETLDINEIVLPKLVPDLLDTYNQFEMDRIETPPFAEQVPPINYHQKYLKYKQKYAKLKNGTRLNITNSYVNLQ